MSEKATISFVILIRTMVSFGATDRGFVNQSFCLPLFCGKAYYVLGCFNGILPIWRKRVFHVSPTNGFGERNQ
jgi:hypothetical protein